MLKLTLWLAVFVFIQWIGCSIGQGPQRPPVPVFPPLSPSNISEDTIVCNSNYTRIRFDDSTLQQLNSIRSQTFFLARNSSQTAPSGSQCVSIRDGSASTINLDTNRIDCAYNVLTTSSTVQLTYLVRFVYAPIMGRILRSFSYEFFLNCTYPRILNISSERLSPVHNERRIKAPSSRSGVFNISFTRRNSFFNQTFTSNGVDSIPTPVYVSGKIESGQDEKNLILQATSCYATPTSNRNDSIRFNIISNSCPVLDAVENGNTTVFLNYAGRYVNFKFDTFYWGDIGPSNSKIYVHCCFQVCDLRVSSTCTSLSCPTSARRKRSLTMKKDEEIETTLGPILVSPPKKHYDLSQETQNPTAKAPAPVPNPISQMDVGRGSDSKLVCDKRKYGCSYNCAQLNTEDVICICPPRFGLAEDGKNCYHKETEKESQAQNSLYDCLKTPILAVLFTGLCYVFIFVMKSEKTKK